MEYPSDGLTETKHGQCYSGNTPTRHYSNPPFLKKRQVPGRQGGGDGESRGKNDQTPDALRLTEEGPVLASVFLKPVKLPKLPHDVRFPVPYPFAGPHWFQAVFSSSAMGWRCASSACPGNLKSSRPSAMLEQEAQTLGLRERVFPDCGIRSPQHLHIRMFIRCIPGSAPVFPVLARSKAWMRARVKPFFVKSLRNAGCVQESCLSSFNTLL